MTTFGLYTLYLSALLPLIESLVVLVACLFPLGGKRLPLGFLVRWVSCQPIALLLFVPWIILFLSKSRPTPALLFPIDLWTFLQASATAFGLGISTHLDRYVPATIAATLLAVLAIPIAMQPARQRVGALLLALVLVPPFVVYALSLPNPVLYAPNLSVRYLLVFLPAYYLLVASGVFWLCRPLLARVAAFWPGTRAPVADGEQVIIATPRDAFAPRSNDEPRHGWSALPRPALGIASVVLLAGIAIWSLGGYYPDRRLKDDFQTVSRFMNAYIRPDDAVVLNSDKDWAIFRYYFAGNQTVKGVSTHKQVAADDAQDMLSSLAAKHAGIWLLTSDEAYDSDPKGVVAGWLSTHARLVGGIAGDRRRLALYTTDPSRSLASVTAAKPTRERAVAFSSGAALTGFDLAAREIAPGETLRVSLYWQAASPLPEGSSVALRLADRNGLPFRAARFPLPAGLTPGAWAAASVARSDHTLPIPKAMPQGDFDLTVELSGDELEGPVEGRRAATLGSIYVMPSGEIATRPEPAHAVNLPLGAIRLNGYDFSLRPSQPLTGAGPLRGDLPRGGLIRLRIYWEAHRAIERSYTAFVQLVGPRPNPATGNPVWSQRDALPRQGERPTDSWLPGEVILDDYELTVPQDAPPGPYYVQVGLYELPSGRRLKLTDARLPERDSVVVFEGQLR